MEIKDIKQREKHTESIGRLDTNRELREKILPYYRLKYGEIWEDNSGRRVGFLDATKKDDIKKSPTAKLISSSMILLIM